MLEMHNSLEIKENTHFIYYEDFTDCYGPNSLSKGAWFYHHNKRLIHSCLKDFILDTLANYLVKNPKVLERYESSEDYLLNRKIYLKQEERTAIEKIIDLTHSLIRNLNQEILNEITLLLKMFNVKLELYYFSNYKEALELVKEHDRLIYSNDLIKTFKEDNTLNFIEINKELNEEYLRDLYFTRFFDREDYKEIPTFYEYGTSHPFYKDLIIKALKENRPITNEDIDEMIRKYPFDRNVIY